MINIVEVKKQLRIVSKLFKSLKYNGYAEYIHYNSTSYENILLRVSIQFNDGAIQEQYTLYDAGTAEGYIKLSEYHSIDELIELNKKERKNK